MEHPLPDISSLTLSTSFTSLPKDLIYQLTDTLNPEDISALCQINPYLRLQCQRPEFWIHLIKTNFPDQKIPNESIDFKGFYIFLLNNLYEAEIHYFWGETEKIKLYDKTQLYALLESYRAAYLDLIYKRYSDPGDIYNGKFTYIIINYKKEQYIFDITSSTDVFNIYGKLSNLETHIHHV